MLPQNLFCNVSAGLGTNLVLLRTSSPRNFNLYFGRGISNFKGDLAEVAIIWAGSKSINMTNIGPKRLY